MVVSCGVLQVYLPSGRGIKVLVGGVASPQALDQHGRRWDLPVEVLLTLLLLYLEGEAGPEDALSVELGGR